MDQNQFHSGSYLFTVRLWAEDLGEGRTEWRGRVHKAGEGYKGGGQSLRLANPTHF